jgi:hypothetical protein
VSYRPCEPQDDGDENEADAVEDALGVAGSKAAPLLSQLKHHARPGPEEDILTDAGNLCIPFSPRGDTGLPAVSVIRNADPDSTGLLPAPW